MHGFPSQTEFVVANHDDGDRMDRWLTVVLPSLSRSDVKRLILAGMVSVDGVVESKPARRLSSGLRVAVQFESTDTVTVDHLRRAPEIPLTILHKDPALIVVDKPSGLVVHAGAGRSDDTLVNALVGRFPELVAAFIDENASASADPVADLVSESAKGSDPYEELRPGIVHRLDRDTSGVLVVAMTPESLRHLQSQFAARTVEKRYLAIVHGSMGNQAGLIDAPIGRDPRRRQRMAVVQGARPARTNFRVLSAVDQHCLVDVRPETGRTHQIRVHLAALGHPIVGDRIYGHRRHGKGRLALHAWDLTFEHPLTGRRVTFTAPLPDDLRSLMGALRLPLPEGMSQSSS